MSQKIHGASRKGAACGAAALPVDVRFDTNRYGRTDTEPRRPCPLCGTVHAPTKACRVDSLSSADPSRNGPYRGPLKVRTIAPGVTGAELTRRNGVRPNGEVVVRPGQYWEGPAGSLWRVDRVRWRMATLHRVGQSQQCKMRALLLPRKRGWHLLAEAS